jgi:hypothetical protein
MHETEQYPSHVCVSHARTWIPNTICCGILCVQCLRLEVVVIFCVQCLRLEVVVIFCVQCLRLEVVVYFIDTGGMVDHCYLTFLFIIK